MKKLLLFGLFAFAGAATYAGADAVSQSRFWLEARGVIAAPELEKSLGVSLSGENRAKFERAVQTRNEKIVAANDELRATMREILREDDEQLQKRFEEGDKARKEAEKLETMRRLQPSRYQEYLRRQKKTEKSPAPDSN